MRLLVIAFLTASALAVPGVSSAQTGGGYDLEWSTSGPGGGLAQAAGYELWSAVGQPAAGEVTTSSPYEITSGFLQDSSYFPLPVQLTAFSVE